MRVAGGRLSLISNIRGGRTARGHSSSWQIHLHKFAMSGQRELTIFCLQTVYMDRTVGRLGRDEFIQWIPGNALDVVRVLCDLPDHLS